MQLAEIQTESSHEPEYQAKITDVVAQAHRCEVTDDATAERATDLAKFIQALGKRLEDDRKSLTGPLNQVIKDINGRFKGFKGELDQALARTKGQILAYQQLKAQAEKERLEAERQAQLEEAAKLAPEEQTEVLEKLATDEAKATGKPAAVRGDFGGVSHTRKTWTFEVENLAMLVMAAHDDAELMAYLALDEKAVKAAIQSGKRTIPGLRIFEHESVVIR